MFPFLSFTPGSSSESIRRRRIARQAQRPCERYGEHAGHFGRLQTLPLGKTRERSGDLDRRRIGPRGRDFAADDRHVAATLAREGRSAFPRG